MIFLWHPPWSGTSVEEQLFTYRYIPLHPWSSTVYMVRSKVIMVLSNWIACFYRSVHLGYIWVSVFWSTIGWCHSLDLASAESCLAGSSTSFNHILTAFKACSIPREVESLCIQVTWLGQTQSCMVMALEHWWIIKARMKDMDCTGI